MESPQSFSTHSEAPPLSEDSGLLITSGSFSSDSASGWHHISSELQESDYDEKSLSPCESDAEPMCGDNFNTVKKGPAKLVLTTIEPPPQFQDEPPPSLLVRKPPAPAPAPTPRAVTPPPPRSAPMTSRHLSPNYPRKFKTDSLYERRQCLNHRFTSPRLLHLSPCRANRPSSRNSLNSRLSSSHNSLVTQFQVDDSTFITQAISHDTLSAKTSDICDMYNVPFDSDIYAVPIDMIKPCHNIRNKVKKSQRQTKKRKSTSYIATTVTTDKSYKSKDSTNLRHKDMKVKRHSFQSSSSKKNCAESDTDSLHMTLREMRKYLQTLYSSSSDSEAKPTAIVKNSSTCKLEHPKPSIKDTTIKLQTKDPPETMCNKNVETNNNQKKTNKNTFARSKKHKDASESDKDKVKSEKGRLWPVRVLSLNVRQGLCNLFGWRRGGGGGGGAAAAPAAAVRRALPPLPPPPPTPPARKHNDDPVDFATSIQKVKDYGWYWGPISVETAEKILSSEPDGSFIVRDSSDDHYIFTLTFKLNGLRHVRIEHDQGNFCFGGCTMFKAATIVEFIENAVETSRSGRYLFFLNLRPMLGPVRVQLLYPVSRFKRVQSLQHMCRFVILKHVRRDLVNQLPLPRRLLDYLSATHYYAELLAEI